MEYDVIIVGAGPAGSAAAQVLAKQGFNILLLDRAPFPREKVCGDGLTPGAVKMLNDLHVLKALPENNRYRIEAIRFATPRLQILDVPFNARHEDSDFLVVPREKLDHALLKQAMNAGAHFEVGTVRNLLLQDGRVVGCTVEVNGQLQERYAKIVIGADGTASVVARILNSRKVNPKHRFLAIRAYVKGFKTLPGLVEFYWTNELKPGYFWIFPIRENEANIGLGLPADLYAKSKINLKEMFFEYLNRPLFAERKLADLEIRSLKSWPIPLAGVKGFQRVFNGAMLVGDAGYWVDPLSGEGIHNALKTGIIAGETAAEALRLQRMDRAFLQRYEERSLKELGGVIRRSLWFVWGMRHTPWLLEAYFWLARHNPVAFQKFFSNLSNDFNFRFTNNRD